MTRCCASRKGSWWGGAYHRGSLEIHDGIGQYFPIDEKRRSDSSASGEGRDGGFHFGIEDIGDFLNKLKEHPGGYRQVLEIRWRF
jgi:hypothetical protein